MTADHCVKNSNRNKNWGAEFIRNMVLLKLDWGPTMNVTCVRTDENQEADTLREVNDLRLDYGIHPCKSKTCRQKQPVGIGMVWKYDKNDGRGPIPQNMIYTHSWRAPPGLWR